MGDGMRSLVNLGISCRNKIAGTRMAFSRRVWDRRIGVAKKGIAKNNPAVKISKVVMILISRHKWYFKSITVCRP
jgi:hypothetical protein